jgi:hypothetical protein
LDLSRLSAPRLLRVVSARFGSVIVLSLPSLYWVRAKEEGKAQRVGFNELRRVALVTV